ncbi:hypothetical protein [Nocardioides acrostichi]|uniref:Lipoprotein n=1 Tax=Nocardioides acrostichi TaxID=2784339 RepID=A0A930Y8U8_9ACTN|nr:hypothetical protein [Nocardioides acrostichi]MBF4163446.1 hypothetical protein [Nocardioides acrostichi]
MNRRVGSAIAVWALLLAAACGSHDAPTDAVSSAVPSPSVSTLPPLPPASPEPPTGRFVGDMEQSSLDAAAGQMQVWVDNDTRRDYTPTRIVYSDPRFRAPVVATRLRDEPAQARRGFPLALPADPRCDVDAPDGSGRLVVQTTAGRTFRLPVLDEAGVVQRWVTSRCSELALERVVRISWAPRVDDGGVVKGEIGTLTLRLRPTGGPGRAVIETVGGSHLLGADDGQTWSPRVVVHGTDARSTVSLSMLPARCDDHAFMEGGNATAFRVNFTVDGEPGQVLLRMSPAGTTHAIEYARAACGYS